MKAVFSAAHVVWFLAALAACAARPPAPGEQRVLEASDDKPTWVESEQATVEEEGVWYFRGQAIGVANLSLGLRQAEADAKKRLVGKIAERVTAEYSEYAMSTGADDEATAFVSDGISWTTDAIDVSGAAPRRIYWERVETGLEYGVSRDYDVYVLVGISRQAYEEARRRTVRALNARARADEQRRVEEGMERLRRRLVPDSDTFPAQRQEESW